MNMIHSLERRPLTELDNVTQQRFDGANTDVNYARMLQTVLRREPDIVMVGECEDRETAMLATRASAENRKIYMGLQAKDSFDALGRYLSLLGDNQLAAKALLGVVNQRLVRLLCMECREAFQPDPATLKKLNLPADKIERLYRPPTEQKVSKRGKPIVCQKCQGSGYLGRTGVFELLVVDGAVRKLVAEGAPINRIKSQCRKNKMYYLQEEALLMVISGKTSMNEVLRCLRGGEEK
jgi:type II secretory ATPase GspE/PulE/Tfp pilus assembly ATPase PilB-like protein